MQSSQQEDLQQGLVLQLYKLYLSDAKGLGKNLKLEANNYVSNNLNWCLNINDDSSSNLDHKAKDYGESSRNINDDSKESPDINGNADFYCKAKSKDNNLII